MNNLSVFSFENQEVRFVDGKPVANDVAKVLGYADPAKTISTKVKSKHRSVARTVTVDGKSREVTVLEEPGIYQLVFGSKLPSAEKFQDWVFEEVLPAIRKTGKYSLAKDSGKPAVLVYADRVMKLKEQLKYVPEDHWVVMQHCGHVLLEVERLGYLVGEYDLCDGSIGSHWGKYRKTVGLTATPEKGEYKVNQCPKPIEPRAYHLDELKVFVKWLEKIYIPKHLPEYLRDRPETIVKAN